MQRLFVYFAGLASLVQGAIPVRLAVSTPSPSTLGSVITFNANASNAGPGTRYRFRVRPADGTFTTVRDYTTDSTLAWTASEHEGNYEIEVSVRDLFTGDSGVSSTIHRMQSPAVATGQPTIVTTANPLVFLYSAPPCPAGSRMQVQFQLESAATKTPFKACDGAFSMNFYLAGLLPNSVYSVNHVIDDGTNILAGPALSLTTPNVSFDVPQMTVAQAPDNQPAGVLLHGLLFRGPVATDLAGNLLWYYPANLSFLTRPERGGRFLGILEDLQSGPQAQFLREFDLAGFTTRETNAEQVNAQLTAMGVRNITSFHHDAEALEDGSILVLASTEQLVQDVQGPGAVDVLGDMILVLDRNLQVVWTWDAFEHLDISRMATLNETCNPGTAGCPPFTLAPQANDWLHGNAVTLTPDGNLLYSARHQDWLIKIRYENGQGNGDIMWRLGNGGDFQLASGDSSSWFTHQHDGHFPAGDNSTIVVFDNGNVRNAADPNAPSRGQVWQIDESSLVATLAVNADLGYSFALGSAQKLPNGNFHFETGWLGDNSSNAIEVDASGKIVYALAVGFPEYRSFRMGDLYTP